MFGIYRPIAALLLAVAILVAGNGLLGTLLPFRAHIERFSTPSIGILGAAYYVGFIVGCWYGSALVARIGHIRTFAVSAAISSAAVLLHALYVDIVTWWIIRVALGACFAGLYIVIESWLNERATNENRGTIMSAYTFTNLIMLMVGQVLMTTYDPAGFPLFLLVAILFSLALVPVGFSTAAAPAPPPGARRVNVVRIFRTSPVGVMGCIAVGFANSSFWALAPVFGAEIGLNVDGIATFMSVAALAGAASQWPIGRLSDRLDRRIIIVANCSLGAIGAIGLIVATRLEPAMLYPSVTLFGLSALTLWSISVSHTNDLTPPGTFVEVSSGLLFLYGIGAIIGPIIASNLMDTVGPDGLFMFAAIVYLSLMLFTLYRMRVRPGRAAGARPAPAPMAEGSSAALAPSPKPEKPPQSE